MTCGQLSVHTSTHLTCILLKWGSSAGSLWYLASHRRTWIHHTWVPHALILLWHTWSHHTRSCRGAVRLVGHRGSGGCFALFKGITKPLDFLFLLLVRGCSLFQFHVSKLHCRGLLTMFTHLLHFLQLLCPVEWKNILSVFSRFIIQFSRFLSLSSWYDHISFVLTEPCVLTNLDNQAINWQSGRTIIPNKFFSSLK